MLSRLPPRDYSRPSAEEPEDVVREFFPPDLPVLESDPFGWTPEELEDAARTARDWLFRPTSSQAR